VFGTYNLKDFLISNRDFEVKIERTGDFFIYTRKIGPDRKESIILGEGGKVIVNPVEPVNLPKEISKYFLVEFTKKVFAEPKSKRTVYVTFPVEIGVFIAGRKTLENIDVFSFNKPKYTLYGDPRNGVVCRHWKSDIYSEIPDIDPLYEGVIRLEISNLTDEWVEVEKAVFNAIGMKIYYDEEIVAMNSYMRITSPKLAETDFYAEPVRSGMKKSLELYTARKIVVARSKFTMEWGL
jgi:hypothetical protein